MPKGDQLPLILLCIASLAVPVGTGPVTVHNIGDSGVEFSFAAGDLTYESIDGMWYPTIGGMSLHFEEGQYVLPASTWFIPVPPGSVPELSYTVEDYGRCALPGPSLISPVQQGSGLESEWVPSDLALVPFATEHAEYELIRFAGTTVAAVTFHPILPADLSRWATDLTVRLSWEPRSGGRVLDRPLLTALCLPGSVYWPEPSSSSDSRDSSPFWGLPWARIAVETTGLYALSGADLDLAGCDATGTPSANLRLWSGPGRQFSIDLPGEEHQLTEIAIEVSDGGDGIFDASDSLYFFAFDLERLKFSPGSSSIERLHHRYATHNVFWLSWGGESGLRVDTLEAQPDGSPDWGSSLVHNLWQEHEFLWLPDEEIETGWVWSMLFENIPGYFYFSTPSLDGTGDLLISLASPTSGDHRTQFHLNNELISDTIWSGSTTIDILLEELDFKTSMNLLKITTSDDPGSVYINSLCASYPRQLSYAADRPLSFTHEASRYTLQVGGAVSEEALLDVTDPFNVQRFSGTLSGSDLSTSLDISAGTVLWLQGSASPKAPDSIVTASPGRIIGTGMEGDVAIIVADELLQEAMPLEVIYGQRGLSTVTVTASEIYQEFGQGVRDPGAIRSFFRYTQDHWTDPARMVLLVGDGTYDPLLHVTSRRTLIPVFLKLGYDNDGRNREDYYVIAHEDGVYPEAPISRIPASSNAELSSYLAKILSYENSVPSGQWTNRIILTADDDWGASTNESYHTTACELLADTTLPRSLDRIKFYLIDYPWPPGTSPGGEHPQKPQAREDLVEELTQGCANMIFFGHGSYDQIAHEKLLVSSDVLRIGNEGRQPVMIFASCDVGHFDMISANSMAEEFSLHPGSGAISTIAATRGTYCVQNTLLYNSYFTRLFGSSAPDIATALWLAKMDNLGIYEFSAYNIVLGDGGVRPVYPDNSGCTLNVDGDTLFRGRMNGMELSFPHGTSSFVNVTESGRWMQYNCLGGRIIDYLHYGSSIYRGFITETDGAFKADFFVPLPADTGSFSRCSGVGLSSWPTESAYDEWVSLVDRGGYPVDTIPPELETWIAGYRDRESPEVSGTIVFRASASDDSGINTMGGGAGRSILMSLDSQGFDISRFFSYLPDSHTSGELDYILPELAEGMHTIILAIWDGMGNTSRDTLNFSVVASSLEPLSSVLVYPNPGSGTRCFSFRTASPGTAQVTVLTVAGRPVWTSTLSCSEGYNQVIWDGRDADGDELASGSYIYRIVFTGSGGSSTEVTEILAVIREME